MIYLHATLLGYNINEESADLYTYRATEFKAVKIGKITRLLKQISVDCIINHSQSILTNENLNTIKSNQNIKQLLSDGQLISNFQVGDIDNSVTCDFMTCEYKCMGNITADDINDSDITSDTYNETFIKTNSDKIINRIKKLMKEKFFYIQNDFISRINFPKKYPLEQIYSALTQLIEDPTEYIIDKYGRTGHLINLGKYYLFQPSEIENKNISMFERMVPINFKNDNININIKHSAVKPVIDKRGLYNDENIQKTITITRKPKIQVLKNIYNFMVNATNLTSYTKNMTQSNETDHLYIVHYLMNEYTSIIDLTRDEKIMEIRKIIIYQYFDLLRLQEKINVLNALEIEDDDSSDQLYNFFINSLKIYITEKIIQYNDIPCIFFSIGKTNDDINYFSKNESNMWVQAEPQTIKFIKNSEFYKSMKITNYNFNKRFGFIGILSGNKTKEKDLYVFKIKEVVEKGKRDSKGYVCGDKQKLMRDIVPYFEEPNFNGKLFTPNLLCIMTYIVFRYNQKIKKDDKWWFVSTEFATLNNFEEKEKPKK
jgi:hypothetical protein